MIIIIIQMRRKISLVFSSFLNSVNGYSLLSAYELILILTWSLCNAEEELEIMTFFFQRLTDTLQMNFFLKWWLLQSAKTTNNRKLTILPQTTVT